MSCKKSNFTTSTKEINGNRIVYHVGDNFRIDVTRTDYNLSDKHSLMNLWKKHGFIKERLTSSVSVSTYYTEPDGTCRAWYNATIKISDNRRVVDFDYLMEYNDENINYIVSKCIEMYNNDQRIRVS